METTKVKNMEKLQDFVKNIKPTNKYRYKKGWVYILIGVYQNGKEISYIGNTKGPLYSQLKKHLTGEILYTKKFKELYFLNAFHVETKRVDEVLKTLRSNRYEKRTIIQYSKIGNFDYAEEVFSNLLKGNLKKKVKSNE